MRSSRPWSHTASSSSASAISAARQWPRACSAAWSLRRDFTDSFVIDSAGLGDWHIGQSPDHRAQKAARTRGIDISGQSARQVVDEDFDRFDLLLVMDGSNYDELKARAPHEARAKIRPFLDYAPHAGTKDVPDPFFGGAEGFDHALDLIEAAAHGLVASLAGKEKVQAKRGG